MRSDRCRLSNDYIQNPFYMNAQNRSLANFPSLTNNFTSTDLTKYFGSFTGNNYAPMGQSYTHSATVVNIGYRSGIYVPSQNRIYMMPSAQSDQTTWHYIDCFTGTVVGYSSVPNTGSQPVATGYIGGIYDPVFNRIILVPYGQGNAVNWHYIDVTKSTPVVTAYTNTSGVTNTTAYFGGCYDPTTQRAYFCPDTQATSTTATEWHYVDCSLTTLSIVGYTRPSIGTSIGSYQGAVYSPLQNRIYFVPHTAANPTRTQWYYLNVLTTTPVPVAYTSPGNSVPNAYSGGVYDPINNKIYFVPFSQANQSVWHYIDCTKSTNFIASIPNTSTAQANAYVGGCYSPVNKCIYFAPFVQGGQTVWHYIDCVSQTIKSYTSAMTMSGAATSATAYIGCTLSPLQNRIYFIPAGTSVASQWQYLQIPCSDFPDMGVMSNYIFNKY